LTGAVTAQVAILGSPGGGVSWNNDVQAKLLASGVDLGPSTIIDVSAATPTLAQLQAFRSVLVYSDSPGYLDANALGTNLKDYVDSGGGVVVCTFTNASIPLGGTWISAQYDPIAPGGQANGAGLTLGTRQLPSHPLFTISPVASFDGGSSSYHGTGTLAANSSRIADWSNGDIFAAERNGLTGRVLSLNFYPVSSSARPDFWVAGTDGDKLMANALVYAAGRRGVAVLSCDFAPWPEDIKAKLLGSGVALGPVSLIDVRSMTPTLAELQRYRSVLVSSDYAFADSATLGTNLKNYVDDGGGVVVCTFANAGYSLGGTWASAGYDPILPAANGSGVPLTLGVKLVPSHPLFTISPVTSFDGGTSSFCSLGGLAPSSTRLANYSNGDILAAERVNISGRVLSLNFFPVSSDMRADFWVAATDGDNLMANALAYTGKVKRYGLLMAESAGSTWPAEVRSKILATGVLAGTVSILDVRTSTPTLAELRDFKSVLVSADAPFENGTELGNNLHDYVNIGGNVVETTFANAWPFLGGRWASDQYSPITQTGQAQGSHLGLGTRYTPGHPIWSYSAVLTFDGGTSSYHSTGTLAPSSYRLGDWSTGDILVAERVLFFGAGLILDLNIFPPSSDSRPDFWVAGTDGDNLMANALRYAQGLFDADNNNEMYCEAKLNSLGCLPVISASGKGSISVSAGLPLNAWRVRNQKPGLLIYTNNGRTSVPFQAGTLCVNSPIRRTIPLNSGGSPLPTNDCSGNYHIDMLTFAHGGLGGQPAAYLLVVGTVVSCQFWGRDPGFNPPNNSTLTNAVEYYVGY
jgi:hypothetical protein